MAFHKPVGVTTTTDPKDPTNIVQFIDYHERLFPIGRLDKDSEGLIFLTNDGNIVNKILRARNAHEKEYIVKVHKSIQPDFIEKMSTGVPILGTRTLPCPVQQLGKSTFRITLIQGMNRQIRRMCEVLGYKVTELKRVRIMDIQLGDLKVGRWRLLTPSEIKTLQATTADSASEHKHTKRPPVIPKRSGGTGHRRGTGDERPPAILTRRGGTGRRRGKRT
jgi:23S rRNA pseudouridine2604 synthase